MNVIKATDSAINAIRKMSSVSRTLTGGQSAKKQSGFIAESVKSGYHGPFRVSWLDSEIVRISAPPEFMGGFETFAGSVCAPDMQIITHINANNITFPVGTENTLLVLRMTWNEKGIFGYAFEFVPDPWKSCLDANRMIAIDHLNPKTEDHPYRNPYISIYPIARFEGTQIVQIQQGHIVEYNRWWRV